MVIDWKKVEKDPEKDWKVVGQLLLDNKDKIEAMEQELAESDNTAINLKAALNEAKSRIKELEEQAQTEKVTGLDAEMEKIQREKEELMSKIQSITKESELKIETLTNQLQDKTQSLTLAEDRLKSSSDRGGAMSDTLDEKNRVIDNLNNIIEEKNKEITDLNDIINEKNNLIERISEDLKEKREESMDLLEKVKERDKRIEEISVRPPIPAPAPTPRAPAPTPRAPAPTPRAPA
ncbi:MAG: hypothetical protein HWN65_20855, partial [Candidatus Helarchaeota archaeon]|nr:hypothetical protein [Candidatus Helarchaeota archaeon]